MIELVVLNTSSEVVNLDVDQNTVIAITKTLLELTDIEKRTGDYSKSFPLPRTPVNEGFFGAFGDPATIGVNWNSAFETKAWLLEDSNVIIEGSLKFESTDSDNRKYNVSISGSLYTIKNSIGETLMSDIYMADWSHAVGDIPDTWDGTWRDGHMIYSVHDFGFGYGLYVKNDDNDGIIQVNNIKKNGSQPAPDPGFPIPVDKTFPAFRLNELIRRMFEGRDYVVSGNWFDEPESEEIYVQVDRPKDGLEAPVENIRAPLQQHQPVETLEREILFDADPPSQYWDHTTFEYICSVDGNHYFELQMTGSDTGVPEGGITVEVQSYKNNVPDGTSHFFEWNESLHVSSWVINNCSVNDRIKWTMKVIDAYMTPAIIFAYDPNYVRLITVTDTSTDGIINPSIFWTGYTQIDFLRAFLQTFNLIAWFKDGGEVVIDTWDYYMKTYGEVKDWSQKVDLTTTPVIKAINDELRNPIYISYKEADDWLNHTYHNEVGRPYGSYEEDTRLPFTRERAEENLLFAPAPTQEIRSNNAGANFPEFVIAKYYENPAAPSYKSPGLQLFYFNGPRTVPDPFYYIYPSLNILSSTFYPYFSNFRLFFGDNWKIQSDTLDLNQTWWTPAADITDDPTNQGLFTRYFSTMLTERYSFQEDIKTKIVELGFLLNATDHANFSFADVIIITLNGTPVALRVLELIDYAPNRNSITKVKGIITFLTEK